ncbi:ubiquinol oxidase subunit II [Candidatus Erwinia haradaeae]|uniref:Ubiquinol oxidase subunit 2 n=1 Tax=Candidatus Erwinia haradaeae TaxID=1922217 RepID=A0A803GCU6_9GAMM|nr:ubiquinol oxidase subunit II [Candidatus Erwinia haradaeae]VFP88646.1 Cytochrome bo(3) ubiquinol oxidase subunit 2 [Candidatus Erwinia haradaeae]
MKCSINNKKIAILSLILQPILLNGCQSVLMDPKGQIAIAQRSLILTAFSLMMIVVLPAIYMAILFSWKYRESNTLAPYNPNWDHSYKVEIIVWTIPILIIIFLSILAWKSTHELEPRKNLRPDIKSIVIEVVSLNWKWLFIYPEQGIATINQIAFPANCPVHFKITSHTVMNSFFVPSLGSQMYAMPGMQTHLNLIANEAGIFNGISSNYSGNGFSHMKFKAIATQNRQDFDQWVKTVKKSPKTLITMTDFNHLAQLNNNYSVVFFSTVKPELFKNIMDQFKINNTTKIEQNQQIRSTVINIKNITQTGSLNKSNDIKY